MGPGAGNNNTKDMPMAVEWQLHSKTDYFSSSPWINNIIMLLS